MPWKNTYRSKNKDEDYRKKQEYFVKINEYDYQQRD